MANHRDLFDPTRSSRLQPEERLTEIAAARADGLAGLA